MRRAEVLLVIAMVVATACSPGGGVEARRSTITEPPPETAPDPSDGLLPVVHDDAGLGWLVTPEGVWLSEPTVREAGWYAEAAQIDLEEARRRNALVDEAVAGKTHRRLQRLDGFGGMWAEETPDSWKLVVAIAGDPAAAQQDLARQLEGSDLLDAVVLRQVEHTLRGLELRLRRLSDLVERWCLPPITDSAVDLYANRAVVGAMAPEGFVAAVENVQADLEGIVVVEHLVDPPPETNTGCAMTDIAELEAARALWEAQGIETYRFLVTGGSAWGSLGRHLVSVDGADVGVEVLDRGQFDATWEHGDFDGVFDWAEGRWEPGVLAVRSHPEWGFIVSIGYDQPVSIDEEWGYRVRAFASGGDPLAAVDEDYRPCDFHLDGLMVGHPDEDRARVRRSVRIAIWDPTLQEFLLRVGDHCSVESVDLLDDADAVVEADLRTSAERDDWPHAMCADGADEVVGIRWTIDLDQETIVETCGL